MTAFNEPLSDARSSNPRVDQSKSRALIVDDDAGILRDYGKIVQRLGLEVETASDGKQATELLRARSFDVVVSDIDMPQMNGIELLRTVRAWDLDVPVILITGRPEVDSAIEAVQHGAFRYLVKPIELEQLSDAVRQGINLHKLARLKREALELVGADGRRLGDHAALEAHFDSALDKMWIAFQPIVDWSRQRVMAYEALARSDEPAMQSPLDLLDAAERLRRVHDLGRRVRTLVASNAASAPEGALIFVNLHALDLNDAELYSPGSPLSALASRVVLEITERASLDGVGNLTAKIGDLRRLGYRLAVDDVGAGYAGLSTFTQVEPEFVKLDMSLIRGVDASTRKRSVVRALAQLCSAELGIQVVTEGVETPSERDVLAKEGCHLLQGYLFAKPERGFPTPSWQPPA